MPNTLPPDDPRSILHNGLMNVRDMATFFELNLDALRHRLNRFFRPHDRCFVEITDAHCREARRWFRVGMVWGPVLVKMGAKWPPRCPAPRLDGPAEPVPPAAAEPTAGAAAFHLPEPPQPPAPQAGPPT
jgi:hypothetical protein